MSPSKIEWTQETWNPTTGCSKVSPGCAHCYAEALSKRYAGAPGWPAEFKPWTPDNAAENVVLHPDRLEAPMHWKTPRRVFVNSMSDLFHEQIPDDFIDQVFAVMALTPQHTYQVLTKRPERMRDYLTAYNDEISRGAALDRVARIYLERPPEQRPEGSVAWPLPNVWLGVSAANQRWADERIPILLDTPAAVRIVSAEPLLGPLELWRWCDPWKHSESRSLLDTSLDWVIVGGESGPRHRPFDPAWAHDIVVDCHDFGVACFVKQLGGFRPGTALEDLPEDLRVREYPA